MVQKQPIEEIPAPRPTIGQAFHSLSEIRNYLWRSDFSRYKTMPSFLNDMRIIDTRRVIANVMYAFYERSGSGAHENPPVVVEVSQKLLDEMGSHVQTAMYLPGTNLILMSSERLRRLQGNQAIINEVLTHELVHYSMDRATGDYSITISSGRGLTNVRIPLFLSEGFATYAAALLNPENNRRQLPITYPHEVATIVLLEKMVGREILVNAFTTGDWTRVQGVFNYHFGENSFRRFLQSRNGSESYNFIQNRLGGNVSIIRPVELTGDPIYMRSRATLSGRAWSEQ